VLTASCSLSHREAFRLEATRERSSAERSASWL
jgi:hypothetical protein